MADNRDRQQSQLIGYQQAQNQLLAIQAQQRQNLAAAKADNNQSAARAQVARQAAGLLTANQQAAVNANLNPQTRGILKKYGLEKPQISHSQQRVGQNVIINNNTTNNYGGPVQGRALNFSDPQIAMKKQQEESGRFKAWLNGLFAKQSEEDAARNRAYEKRERELEKSSRSVTKKMGEIGKNIMTGLSPKRIMSSMNDGLKKILMIFGMHLVAANWDKIITTVADIENKVKESLEYFGIIKSENPSSSNKGFMYDFRYILGGEEAAKEGKSIIQLFKKILVGEKDGEDDPKSLWGHIKMYFSHKAEERKEALGKIALPKIDNLENIPALIQETTRYLGDVIKVLISGADGMKSVVANNIKARAGEISAAYQDENKNRSYLQDVLDEDSDLQISHKVINSKKETIDVKDISGMKGVDASTMAVARGTYMGQYGSNTNILDGSLKNTVDAKMGQGAELARQLDNASHGGIDTAGVMNSFHQLYSVTSEDKKDAVLPSYVFDSVRDKKAFLSANRDNIEVATYKYIITDRDEDDKAQEGDSIFYAAGGRKLVNEAIGGEWTGAAIIAIQKDFTDLFEFAKMSGETAVIIKRKAIVKWFNKIGGKWAKDVDKQLTKLLGTGDIHISCPNKGNFAKFLKFLLKSSPKIITNVVKKLFIKLATLPAKVVVPYAGWALIAVDIVSIFWEIFSETSLGQGFKAFLKGKIGWGVNSHRLKLVPENYECKAGEYETNEREQVYIVNRKGLRAFSNSVLGTNLGDGDKFDISNETWAKSVDSGLRKIAGANGYDGIKNAYAYEDMSVSTAFRDYNDIKALEQQHNDERAKFSTYAGESSDRLLNETSAGRSVQSLYRGVAGNFSSQNLSYHSTGDGGQSRFHVHRNSGKHALNVRAATEYAQKNMKDAAYYQNHINPRKKGWDKETGTGACAAGVREILSKGGGLVNGVDFRRGDANTWFDSLTEFGWYNLGPNIEAAEPGDVVATDPNLLDDSGKKHMHVQFLGDDGIWYSDFAQKSWYPYLNKSFMAEFKAGAFVFRWPNKIGGSYSYLAEGTDTSNGLYLEDKSTIDNYEKYQAEDFTAKFFGTSVDDVINGVKDFAGKLGETAWNGMEGTIFENTSKYGVTPLGEGDLITPELCGYEKYLNACKEGTLRYLPPGLTLENYMANVKAMTGKNPGELLQGGVFSGSFSSVNPKATKTSRNGFISTPFTTGGVTYNNPTEALASKIGQSVQSNADIQNSGTVAIIEQLSNLNQTMKGVELNTGMQINNSKGSTPPITSAQRELTTGASS